MIAMLNGRTTRINAALPRKSRRAGRRLLMGLCLLLPTSVALATPPPQNIESNHADARLGWSVSPAGDVNGDGYVDVLVGAPTYVVQGQHVGAAFLYLGGASGLSTTPSWSAFGTQD